MTAPVFAAAKAGTTAFTDTVTLGSVDGGSNPNRCILALLWAYGGAGTITGAKCNGVAMSIAQVAATSASPAYKYQMFYIVSDSTITTGATNSIEADFAGGVTTHGSILAATYSGVSAVGVGINNSVSTQSPSWANISGATGDLAVALAIVNNNAGHAWTGGTGVTIDANAISGGILPSFALSKASASVVTVNATIASSGDGWLGVGVSLAAVAAAAGLLPPSRFVRQAVNRASTY